MSTHASFTYLGLAFDTPDGFSGFVAANDGTGTVPAKNVIIVGGSGQEHRSFWLEFSADDAITLAEGIIDAAEHAEGRCEVNADDGALDWDSVTQPPGELTPWYEDEDGRLCRSFVAGGWVLATESSEHCPCCREVHVDILGVQESCGCIAAGISLAADSELTSFEARELAAMLTDAAAALEALEQRNVKDGGVAK